MSTSCNHVGHGKHHTAVGDFCRNCGMGLTGMAKKKGLFVSPDPSGTWWNDAANYFSATLKLEYIRESLGLTAPDSGND